MRSKTLGRNITILAVFLAFMGMGVVDPILPNIATNLGANHWQIEMLFSSYILMMSLFMLPAGALAEKFGDKRIMVIGLGLVAIFASLCATSDSILSLSLFRAGWGFSNALFFSTALIMLILLSSDYHKAVAVFEGAIGFGIASGPLLGGFLGEHSWKYPFLATGVLASIAFFAVIFFVKLPKDAEKREAVDPKDFLRLFSNKKFLFIAFASMLYFYGFIVILAYSPLVVDLTPMEMGLIYFGWGAALAVGSIVVSTKLEDKYPVKVIVPVSIVLFAFVLLAIMNVDSKYLMGMLIIFSGLLSGVNNSLLTSYVMELDFKKNIISGGFNSIRWLGAASAPILSGVIAGATNMHIPFLVAAVLSLISAGLLFTLRQK